MSDWNAISAFMAAVVPWPGSPQDPGYVNLQYSMVNQRNPNSKLLVAAGWPFRTVDSLISRASWVTTTSQFKDVWYCLSLQSKTKPNPNSPGKLKAVRAAANALAVKAIWIDIDVGPPEQGKKPKYPTLEAALKAAIKFREAAGLPPFSAIVGSGGGIHCYWISDKALLPAEWKPYAEGLKALLLQHGVLCDAGLTTDIARILRVPGTFNYKTAPPKPVLLFNVPLVMYDFPTALAQLPQIAPAAAQSSSAPEPHNIFADGADMSTFKTPAFKVDGPDLNAGIEKFTEQLLSAEPILKQCGFLSHALKTGGKDYDNPLWNLSVLCSTFMENGNAIAHALSKEHASYTPADTQALYDRKLAERHDRGLGYPSCATIQGNGCKSCASCPLFPKGKSPLNIRPKPVTATVRPSAAIPQSPTALNLSLPVGYDVNEKGWICKVVEQEIDGELTPPLYLPLFMCVLTDPWVSHDPDCINVTTTYDKGRTIQTAIKFDDISSMDLSRRLLSGAKIKPYSDNKKYLEMFLMSWLSKLHEAAAAQQSLPFGWYKEGDLRKGFAYGGKLYKDDGTISPCSTGDPKVRQIFHPQGDINTWYDAAKCITNQRRPELDAIIALSFAAPLMGMVGKNAATLCAYGESGAGKTAAYSVGVSVWGHSKKGKAVSHSTFNQVMKNMGELSNLPLFWDEIKDPKAQAAVYDYIYNATDGVEKGRLKADTSQQDRGTWQTAMMMAANISFTDYVMAKDPSHVAGVSRVLEYHVKKVNTGPGRISATDADVIIDKLQTSYGNVGALYAQYLATNHKAVADECVATTKQVEADMVSTPEERIWTALVGCLLVGARLANELGAELGLPALKSFLYDVYKSNRRKRDEMMAVSGQRDTTEAIMTGYFDLVQTHDQGLWTIGMSQGAGKPDAVSILHQPKDIKNVSVTIGVATRWDVQSRTLYVHKEHLVGYLTDKGVGVGTCLASLSKEYGMEIRKKLRIGAGVFDTGRATLCVFPNVGPDHDWADMMYKYTSPSERPKPTEPPQGPTTVDTGFDVDETTGLATPESVIAMTQAAVR